jgi:LCP family protein required for cell wall assembly
MQPKKPLRPQSLHRRNPPPSKVSKGDRRFRAVLILLGIAFVITTLLAGVAAFATAKGLAESWTGTGLNPFSPLEPTPGGPTPAPGSTPVAPVAEITPIPWNGSERVTILVMGLDYRDWLAGEGAPRTDTMMLVSYDPITKKAGMMSIPRDLWVEIPGFTHNRINTAYVYGESNRLPGGGPALAAKTVEALVGIPIPYYMVVDFSTFEKMIDEIGGIDVLVAERIKIAPIGRLAHWLDAKPYHLDGADALAYARIRKGAGDDFGRAQRQQQVVLAILDRVVGLDMLPQLVTKAPALYQELSGGVRTNLSLQDMISLSWLVVRLNKKTDIQSGVIAPPKMVGFYTRPDGAAVLRPVPDQIRILRDQLFTVTSGYAPDAGLAPAATASP